MALVSMTKTEALAAFETKKERGPKENKSKAFVLALLAWIDSATSGDKLDLLASARSETNSTATAKSLATQYKTKLREHDKTASEESGEEVKTPATIWFAVLTDEARKASGILADADGVSAWIVRN